MLVTTHPGYAAFFMVSSTTFGYTSAGKRRQYLGKVKTIRDYQKRIVAACHGRRYNLRDFEPVCRGCNRSSTGVWGISARTSGCGAISRVPTMCPSCQCFLAGGERPSVPPASAARPRGGWRWCWRRRSESSSRSRRKRLRRGRSPTVAEPIIRLKSSSSRASLIASSVWL